MSAEATARETTPGRPGSTRYICIWPACEWFADLHAGDWVAEYRALRPIDPYVGGDSLATMVQRWWDHVEDVLRQHLDDEHPGWTMEAFQAHAKAWGILELMDAGDDGALD